MAVERALEPGGIRLASMHPDHLPEVMEIERLCFAAPWGTHAFIRELSSPDICYYIVAIGSEDRVLGFAGLWAVADEGHITTLAVHPRFQRRHIGEALLQALLEEASRRELRRVTLEYRQSNVAAQGLYEKYGFSMKAIRRAYYRPDGEDAVIMGIEDIGDPGWQAIFEQRRSMLEHSGG